MLGVSTCNAAAVARLPALLLLALLLAGGADAALSKGPKVSPGRHICHSIDSTLPLTAVACHSLWIYTVILLSSQSFFPCRNDSVALGPKVQSKPAALSEVDTEVTSPTQRAAAIQNFGAALPSPFSAAALSTTSSRGDAADGAAGGS